MDRLLTLMGLARRAGKLALGEEPVYAALRDGSARAVFLAADAAENTRRRLLGRAGPTPVYPLSASKYELGRALGRETCALAAVTDPGFAKSLTALAAPEQARPHDGGVTT